MTYAPYKERLKNCVERLKMDERTGKEMIRNVDRARDAYQVRYAGYLPGDFHHTDLLITWLYKMTLNSAETQYYMASVIGILVFVVVAVLSLIVYNVIPSTKNEEDFR